MESPQRNYISPILPQLTHFFNWTMTYRRDSDFYHAYGYIVQTKRHPAGNDFKEFLRK